MRVGILGSLEVVVRGEPAPIAGARLRALLIRLALDAGHTVTVDALAQALWPDTALADPAHALQSLVSRLRRAVPGEVPVRSVPGGYRLELPAEAVDVARFESLVRDGRRELAAGRHELAAARLREGLGLWRGAALADVADAPYAAATVARLDELRLTALEDRITVDLKAGSVEVVAELQELIAAHPFRERLRVLLLEALVAGGRRSEALAAYAEYRTLAADELGTEPGGALREAHLAVLRSGDAPRPRPRGTLRTPVTSFVGRDEERARITEQLATARLVTLVGPGGAGKTRLATTVAAALPGPAWLVELAGVSEPDEVPRAAVGALEVPDAALPGTGPGPDPLHRLVEALSGADNLVVLDNCEHVIDAAAGLADELLGRCPRLRILATSREPLGLTGETLGPVPPLPLPGDDQDDAATNPAVRLFADRATAAHPGFALTPATTPSVAEICRHLDGLPLAIELAAARLRAMSVDQLATRLTDRFRVLTGGSRAALARHRTLHAVVTWSWDLLTDHERCAAERLAVFPSTFDAEAAEHLGVAVETLDALVDKSLLHLVGGPRTRYRMLETIREFGREQLGRAGQFEQARAEHASYVLGLAERAAPHLRGADQLRWVRRLTEERDNLLAALQFACAGGDADTAVRLGAALAWFWTVHGEHAEGAHRLRLVLDVPGATAAAAAREVGAGYLFNAVHSGAPPRGTEELADLARAAGPGDPAAAVIDALLALIADDTPAGLAAIDAALPHPDPWTTGVLWLTRTSLRGSHAGMTGMWHDLDAAATAFRAAGERWGLSTALTYLAVARSTAGDLDAAAVALQESMEVVRELGTDHVQRVMLAMVRVHLGDLESARAELRDVIAAARSATHVAMARVWLADIARCDGELAEAQRQLALVAADRGADAGDDPLFRSGRGKLAVERGELGAAEDDLRVALRIAAGMPDMPMVASVAVGVAQLASRRGAPRSAAEVLGAAHALRGAADAADPDVRALAAALGRVLGEPAYRAAYDRGRDADRAAALALIEAQLAAASRSA